MTYNQMRIGLLTFTIGLLSIPFINFVQIRWIESSVKLPQAESKNIIVLPMTRNAITKAGWGGANSSGKIIAKS